jgi:hypothetical protein
MAFVRLKPYDRQQKHVAKTWVSPRRHFYTAGIGGMPSTIVEVNDPEEIAYVRALIAAGVSQFEVIEAAGAKDLNELVQREMETSMRVGGVPVRAVVLPAPAEVPLPKAMPRLAPEAVESAPAPDEEQKEDEGKDETPVRTTRGARAKNKDKAE